MLILSTFTHSHTLIDCMRYPISFDIVMSCRRHYYAPGVNKPWIAALALFWIVGTSLGERCIVSRPVPP